MFLSQSSHLFSEATALLQDRKFDTALRITTVTSFITRKEQEHHWSDDLIWIHHPEAETYRSDTTLLPSLLFNLLSEHTNTYKGRLETWQDMWQILEKNLLIQHTWISDTIHSPLEKNNINLHHLLQKYSDTPIVARLISVLDNLNDIINQLPKINDYIKGKVEDEELIKIKSKLNTHESSVLQMKFAWSNKIIIIEWKQDKWILPKAYLLQMHNKIADIISILLYSKGSSGIHHPENFYDIVLDYIKLLCSFHVRYPTVYFEFAKALEGLCIGTLIHKTDDWMNDTLFNSLIDELNELFLIDFRHHPLVTTITESPIDVVVELSCLSKITGHPFCEIKEGAEKLYRRVNEPFDVSVEAVSFCVSTFKENFIRNYILKFNKWPNVTFDPSMTHRAIVYCYPRGVDPYSKEITHRYGRLSWTDWANVELLPELRFNYCENIIPLLKDKALSILRSKVFNQYIKKAASDMKEETKERRSRFQDTRVLLHYLFTSELETDHQEYIRDFCHSSEDFHELLDYLVIRLVPKEKELKSLPRFFGCKTFLDRARTIVGEQNLATYLNLFCDEQGMTLSELALIKKLYAMQNLSKLYKTHKVFKISLDAEAWNTKQRNQTNKPFASQTLDRLFNTNLYSKTHDAYEKSFVYVPDEEETHWWDGQAGGVEGLNQNQWVALYTAEMRYSFKDTAFPFHQIIHGDDYRAAVAVPYSSIPPGEEKEVVRDLMENVSEAAKAFGHKIKLIESYASEHILCYSKIIFCKGIQLPSALRKIQKTYGATNAFLPILDDYIGSSFSNAHSACYTTVNHYVPYIVALFWSCYYFKNSPHYNSCSQNDLIALTLTPSVVGGPPIIYLHNMFVRGESDLLCAFIHLCQHCLRNFPVIGARMVNFLKIPFSTMKPYSLLLKDPYSLPLRKPLSISLFLKRIVRRRLLKTVRNNHVRDLLQGYDENSLQSLIENLLTANEWQAKPFTALYSNSPYHLLDELMSGFVSAKSIRDLLITSSRNAGQSQRILKKAIEKDAKFHQWRVSIVKGEAVLTNYILSTNECPAEIANNLREYAWGIPISTVTHPPPQHQVSFGTQSSHSHNIWALDNHFVMTLHNPNFIISENRWHYADGGKIPFVGHTTSAGVITPTIRVSEKDPVASKVSNLLTLRSWMNKSQIYEEGVVISEFPQFIDKILTSYTNIPADDLQKFAPAWKSGSITHRLRAHGFRDTIVPNNLMNLYTLVTGETNTHRHFRETRDDFTVNYLHIFCYSTNIMLLDLEFCSAHVGPESIWVITTSCDFCNVPIEEPPLVFEKKSYLHTHQPMIQMTHLGEAATELIKLAQQEYDILYPTLDVYGNEEIPLEIAQVIVIYECLKKAWDERVTLSKRYGLYDMTGQGLGLLSGLASLKTEKTLGETELRALPLQGVIDVLATYILYFILRETHNPHKDEVNSRFNTIIPSHLPWFTLIEWYYKAGLLRQLIRQVHRLTDVPPHEGCYYNTNTATIYIGKVLTDYSLNYSPVFPYIPGAVRDTTETLYKRYIHFYTRCLFTHHKHHHNECREMFRDKKFEDLTYDERDHILEGYLAYSRNPLTFETFLERSITERGQTIIEIQDSTQYTDEEFSKWNNDPLPGILKHYYYHHRHLVVDVLAESDDLTIDEIINQDRGIITDQYTITRYPIGACIDIVRSNGVYDDKILGNPADYDDHDDEDDLDLIIHRDENHTVINIPVLDNLPIREVRGDFNFRKINHPMMNLPWSNITRVLGASISSCNKIAVILEKLGLFRYELMRGWILCCGEGEGGILHFLLKSFPNSLGIFNTLIDDLRSGASAGICDKDPTTSTRYYSEPLKQGVSDLTLPSTITTYITRYPQKVFIFTCDADMRNMSANKVKSLWNNVVTWWLQVRTQNGILILKVFSDYFKEMTSIISRLSYYSITVLLHRASTSHLNTEYYVTAQGTSRPYSIHEIESTGTHPDVHATVLNFITPIYEIYRHRKTAYDPTYCEDSLRVLGTLSNKYSSDQGLLLYIISQKLRLPIPHVAKSLLHDGVFVLLQIRNSVKDELEDLEERINNVVHELRHSFLASDTLRHRLQLLDRFLFLTGVSFSTHPDNLRNLINTHPIDMEPNDLINRILQILIPLGGFHVNNENPHLLHIGAYDLDSESVLYKAFGASLQLLGVLTCREAERRATGMGDNQNQEDHRHDILDEGEDFF